MRDKMKAGSAAKLIVDALLQRFLPLARRRIETAQAQVSFARSPTKSLSGIMFNFLECYSNHDFMCWKGVCLFFLVSTSKI